MFRDAHQNVSPWRQKCAKIRNLQKYVVVVDVSLPPLASPTASPLFHKLVPARATCRPTLENALVSQPLNNARPPSGLPPAVPRPPPSCVGKLLSYSLGTLVHARFLLPTGVRCACQCAWLAMRRMPSTFLLIFYGIKFPQME